MPLHLCLADTISKCSGHTLVVLHKGQALSHSAGDALCKAKHGASAGLAIGRADVLSTATQLVRKAQVGVQACVCVCQPGVTLAPHAHACEVRMLQMVLANGPSRESVVR
jgi:hypothetical protein